MPTKKTAKKVVKKKAPAKKAASGPVIKHKPTVFCGKTAHKGTVCGGGIGLTKLMARNAAIADAQMRAEEAGQNWINAQICPLRCMVKTGDVYYWGSRPSRNLPRPTMVAINEFIIRGRKIYKACVVLKFVAEVVCKTKPGVIK